MGTPEKPFGAEESEMKSQSESVDLAVDVVLHIMIGPTNGEIEIYINDVTLFLALYSVRDTDNANFSELAKLLRFAFIRNRRSSSDPGHNIPSPEQVERWRKVALGKGPMMTISF
jgi:hypothetical protein